MKKYIIIVLLLLIPISIIGINNIDKETKEDDVIQTESITSLNKDSIIAYTFEGSPTSTPIETYINGLGSSYITTGIECNEGTTATITKMGVIKYTSMTFPISCTINFGPHSVGPYLVDHILDDNGEDAPQRLALNNDFDSVYVGTENTFFKTNNAEHGDTVYYYAGANTSVNNWVIFGTCKDSTYNCTPGDDLYWRIIRTNEASTGGGVRLLYAGSGYKTENGIKVIADNVTNAIISTSRTTFSDSRSNKTRRYVGYTFGSADDNLSTIRGTTGQSAVKTLIEQWYAAQFPTLTDSSLRERISTKAVYCNDRSIGSPSITSTTTSFGSSQIDHGAWYRLITGTGHNPSYACGAKITGYDANSTWYYTGGNDNADRYTGEVYESNGVIYGNGLLKDTNGILVPVALMTADEAAFAGGKYGNSNSNSSLWYYVNKEGNSITGYVNWWTLSPFFSDSSYAYVLCIKYSNYGLIGFGFVQGTDNVARPVLSLDSETLWLQGDGTASDPYRIVEN